MSDFLQWRLVRRVAAEHRAGVVVLAILLLLNIAAYAAFVYPLSQEVRNAATLTASAENELTAARLEHTQASNLVSGRARSAEKLETFYRKVIPADAATARRITSPRLRQLAKQAGVNPESVGLQTITEKGHVLTRLDIHMAVSGTYDGVRRFIHLLERAPEFVTVVNIQVVQRGDDDGELDAELDLATYYRGASQ